MIIKLRTIEDVYQFVNIATQFGSNVDIKQQHYVVDGKSILGIFSLNLTQPVELNVHNDDYSKFEQFKYESEVG